MSGKSARRLGVREGGDRDRAIMALAQRQHGVVSLEQLEGAGLSADAVQKRAQAGRLHRVHYGAYAVGYPPLTREARWMAAVLASGPKAVLSHSSAAALWRLRPDRRPRVDVTAPGRRGRSPRAIAAHRSECLRTVDTTVVNGIPCTTVARTLLDLAGVLGMHQLRDAVGEAEVSRVLDPSAIRETLRRSRGRRGVARLRLIIDDLHPQLGSTRNPLEWRFLELCRQARLPEPQVNVNIEAGGEILQPDFMWRSAGLIVETDGGQFHSTATAFQRDRRREQLLTADGWQVIPCTWQQVTTEPALLIRSIKKVLQATRSADTPNPPTGRYPDV